MPAKKKGKPAARKSNATSKVAAGQVAKLRKTIATLDARLKRELGASKLNQKLIAQTKKAHAAALKAAKDLKARFDKDRKTLADRAAKVAADLKRRGDELKAAVANSDRVKKAHDAAQKAATDLKARFDKEKSDL